MQDAASASLELAGGTTESDEDRRSEGYCSCSRALWILLGVVGLGVAASCLLSYVGGSPMLEARMPGAVRV